MAEFIAKGKPPNMPVRWLQLVHTHHATFSCTFASRQFVGQEAEWQKLNRKYRKNQASVRAASSIRRTMDEAELHGKSNMKAKVGTCLFAA
jgi:DNA replication protein DnaC